MIRIKARAVTIAASKMHQSAIDIREEQLWPYTV